MQAFLGELGGRLQTNMTWVMFVVIFLSQVNFIFFCFNLISITIPKNKRKRKSTWNKKVITTIFTSSSININATVRGWKLLHSMLLISPWWCMLPKSEYNGHLKRVVSGVLAMHFMWNRIWGKMQTAANASKSTLIIFDCFLTLNCTVWSWN